MAWYNNLLLRIIHSQNKKNLLMKNKNVFSICNRMSLDFVLTSKINNNIICVIELDDESHNREDRKNVMIC
ncbi:DUF2726 domain-containing protein [Proteus mirabilis]|uniref:DUF2726 domain-containing protein n=1 Tax=Klebsiella pneumoniae TaxID=573 RepID=UPI00090774CB|nr:DUF2726 domain-containing protein [Escherichia coli]MCJ2931109.1 DUF2726 domain-containing protein [Escherichia coli]MDY8794498.1 DUF2726 domain-containing protein [Escherichia coli]MDY8807782.1 DUF2726 domain-containing protein [Escherichia coli]MDY8858549.1 DUF2726 domain-containing protein [Escherichia coli]